MKTTSFSNIMKKKVKDQKTKKENTPRSRARLWIRLICVILCILLVVAVCSCCALLEISRIKRETHKLISEDEKARIYIDQGHNPSQNHNIGAEGNGLFEQDLTFDIGLRLAELLEKDGRFEVCLSRPDESTVLGTDNASSLKARVDGAAAFDADYFISLHINSYSEESVNGIEVFAYGEDSESHSFGSFLLQGMLDATSLKDRGMKETYDLYVLKNATMPAVLLEMGFISNPDDAALLKTDPELFAKGIYDGILNYFESAYTTEVSVLLWVINISLALASALIVSAIIVAKKAKRGEKDA